MVCVHNSRSTGLGSSLVSGLNMNTTSFSCSCILISISCIIIRINIITVVRIIMLGGHHVITVTNIPSWKDIDP